MTTWTDSEKVQLVRTMGDLWPSLIQTAGRPRAETIRLWTSCLSRYPLETALRALREIAAEAEDSFPPELTQVRRRIVAILGAVSPRPVASVRGLGPQDIATDDEFWAGMMQRADPERRARLAGMRQRLAKGLMPMEFSRAP